MRNFSQITPGLCLSIATGPVLAKDVYRTLLDETLTEPKTVLGVPLSKGTHVVVSQSERSGDVHTTADLGEDDRVGNLTFAGGTQLSYSEGRPELSYTGPNIGDGRIYGQDGLSDEQRQHLHGLALYGTLAKDQAVGSVTVASGAGVSLFCEDAVLSLCTGDATSNAWHLFYAGKLAASQTLDGIDVAKGDAIMLTWNGGLRWFYNQSQPSWHEFQWEHDDQWQSQKILMTSATVIEGSIVAFSAAASAVVNGVEILADGSTISAERYDDDSLRLAMAPGKVYQVDGLPLGQSTADTYLPNTMFDTLGHVAQASIGAPYTAFGYTFPADTRLTLAAPGSLTQAALPWGYSFAGQVQGRDVAMEDATLTFDAQGSIINVTGYDNLDPATLARERAAGRVVEKH